MSDKPDYTDVETIRSAIKNQCRTLEDLLTLAVAFGAVNTPPSTGCASKSTRSKGSPATSDQPVGGTGDDDAPGHLATILRQGTGKWTSSDLSSAGSGVPTVSDTERTGRRMHTSSLRGRSARVPRPEGSTACAS